MFNSGDEPASLLTLNKIVFLIKTSSLIVLASEFFGYRPIDVGANFEVNFEYRNKILPRRNFEFQHRGRKLVLNLKGIRRFLGQLLHL